MTSLITPADRIRELRACLGQLAEPIARMLPMVPQRRRPDHAELRQRMPLLGSSSAKLGGSSKGGALTLLWIKLSAETNR